MNKHTAPERIKRSGAVCFILRSGQLSCPAAFLQQKSAEERLYYLCRLTEGKEDVYVKRSKVRKRKRNGYDHRPHIYAVEKHRNAHHSARAESEIRGVGEGVEGHRAGGDHHKVGRKRADRALGIVDKREEAARHSKERTHSDRAHNGEGDHLAVGVLCAINIARAELISDKDSDGRAEREIHDIEYIQKRRLDILRRHDIKASCRVALIAEHYRDGPEEFVHHQGQTLDGDPAEELPRDEQGAVGALDVGIEIRSCVRPNEQDTHFNEAGYHGSDSRSDNPKRRKTEVSEDEQYIENEVCRDSGKACDHRHQRIARLTHSRAVDLAYSVGD